VLADGNTPGYGPLLVKYGLMFGLLALGISFLPTLLLAIILGWLYCLFNPRRRSAFDLVAGTYVIKDARRAAADAPTQESLDGPA
jgi:uncharacterized RDD family membrane protein YckC